MNQRKIGGKKRVTADHPDAGVESFGESHRLLLERPRSKQVGGRVDKIAAKRDRGRDALDPVRVDAVGRDEAGAGRGIGLEAIVAVKPEQEPKGGELGVRRRVGESVDALGQQRRELARGERIADGRVDRVDPEQDAADRSGLAGQNLQSPSLRPEAAPLGEVRARFANRSLDGIPIFGAGQPDRDGVGRRGGRMRARAVSVRQKSGPGLYRFRSSE